MKMNIKQGFGNLATIDEAKLMLSKLIKEKEDELLPLSLSLNRYLAEDIVSKIDVPHFEKSAMDGYAVIAQNTFGASATNPKKLKIIDSITAGIVSKKEIKSGECIRITTGSSLPSGADAVLMLEYTEEENNSSLIIHKATAPGDNIVKIGSDMKKDSTVLKKGTKLNPRYIGAISAIGKTKIKVKKVPKIAYFSTGNEIIKSGTLLQEGKIFDINSATICSAIKEQNCELKYLGVIPDNLNQIKNTIKTAAISKDIDIILLSGGSSLGGEDFMVQAIKELGTVYIHGIAVKPGKPTLIGKVNDKLVLGLPGYPTSALSNFYILVTYIIALMQGSTPIEKKVQKKLSRKHVSTIGRYEFMAVKIEGDYAIPVLKGSSSITTLTNCDGFVGIEQNTEVLNKDDIVEVILL